MRRFLIPALGVAAAGVLAACTGVDHPGACYESGATPYPVHAPGDTSVVFHWPNTFQPVRYWVEPVGNLTAHVDNGLHLWVNAFRCGELALQFWADSASADVIIRNPSQLPATQGATTLAADSVNACRGRTDIFLDSLGRMVRPLHSWVVPSSPDSAAVEACYQFVTAHEIGHTLGLLSHSSDPADLMYAVPRHTVLSVNDRYTIQALYHFAAPTQPVPR
jgi:hypothetical protein